MGGIIIIVGALSPDSIRSEAKPTSRGLCRLWVVVVAVVVAVFVVFVAVVAALRIALLMQIISVEMRSQEICCFAPCSPAVPSSIFSPPLAVPLPLFSSPPPRLLLQ